MQKILLLWSVKVPMYVGVICCILIFFSVQPVKTTSKSQPVVIYNQFEPLGELTSVSTGSNRLFALYAHKQIVQAYTLDGEYLYSILFPYSYGPSMIYSIESDMYFTTQTSKVYHYNSDQFQNVMSLSAYPIELQRKLKSRNTQTGTYYCGSTGDTQFLVKGLNVYAVTSDGQEQIVIQRPAWLYLFQTKLLFIVSTLIWVSLFVGVLLIRNYKP